ncbi:MAG: hypothetical protein K2K22_04725 [Muribaculaceae bacterium]|nr:hypothetical protein [Muribaculaceae bacterium]
MRAETSKERVYNPHLTEAHPIDSQFKMSFAEILHKDYGDNTYGFSADVLGMLCIDHDAWEKSVSGQENDKTMDCSTSIAAFDNNRFSYSHHRHLLIELKLKCVAHNLNKNDYTGKIGHSRSLLTGHPQHPSNIFIFTEKVQRKAKSDIAQWSRGSGGAIFKSVLAMTPGNLNEYIGFEHQFPYKPLNERQKITEGLTDAHGDPDKLYKILSYWKEQAALHMGAYRHLEYLHICTTIASISDELLDSLPEGIDKEAIRIELTALSFKLK